MSVTFDVEVGPDSLHLSQRGDSVSIFRASNKTVVEFSAVSKIETLSGEEYDLLKDILSGNPELLSNPQVSKVGLHAHLSPGFLSVNVLVVE